MIRVGDQCVRIYSCCLDYGQYIGEIGTVFEQEPYHHVAFKGCDCGYMPPEGTSLSLFGQTAATSEWACTSWLVKDPGTPHVETQREEVEA